MTTAGEEGLGRRDLLGLGLALGGAVSVGPAVVAARPGADARLADPVFNMHAVARLLGRTDGRVAFYHARGVMFGMRPGEHARALLAFEGCAARLFRLLPDGSGYALGLREWLLFRDPKTGEVAESWRNPYTRREGPLPHFRGGGGMKHRWTVSGQGRVEQEALAKPLEPQVYAWDFEGDRGVCTIEQFIAFPAYVTPEQDPVASTGPVRYEMQVRTFAFSRRDLFDPARAFVPVIETWVMKNDWMPFMMMGNWPGHHIWRASGRKLPSLDALPASFVAETERRWPGTVAEFESWTGG